MLPSLLDGMDRPPVEQAGSGPQHGPVSFAVIVSAGQMLRLAVRPGGAACALCWNFRVGRLVPVSLDW